MLLIRKMVRFNMLLQICLLWTGEKSAIITFQEPPDSTWTREIENINMSDVGLREFLQGVAIQNNLNCIVDENVDQKISLHLNHINIWDLFQFLAKDYNLDLQWQNNILKISNNADISVVKEKSPDRNLEISVIENMLTIRAKNYPIDQVVDSLASKTGFNILLEKDASEPISITLTEVPVKQGLYTVFKYHGYKVTDRDGILHVNKSRFSTKAQGKKGYQQVISFQGVDNISLDLRDAKIDDVIQEIIDLSSSTIISYNNIPGNISIRSDSITLDQALTYILKNTQSTFRNEDGIYFIGDKSMKGMATHDLVKLKHIKSSGVTDLLPTSLKREIEIKEVKELNSLMLIGTRDLVSEVNSFIKEIDQTTPQIMIEALVVDYQLTKLREFELKLGSDPAVAESGIMNFFPVLDTRISKSGLQANAQLDLPNIISRNIGYLPQNFYAQLRALEQDGIVNIQSKPHIATLNGHEANLIIKNTKYFKLISEVVIPTQGTATTQTTERFEKVETEISLKITPWVSADGEITVEIRPEFSIPGEWLDPNIPPPVNSRILNSTVRLKDGETIVLGGLIQENTTDTQGIFPILGNIPVIGKLFRSYKTNKSKSELVIYLTPLINMPAVDLEEVLEEDGIDE